LGMRAEPNADAHLLERCRRHDREAFGQLVDAYQGRVFGFVRRMLPSQEDAWDVTQEVFIRAYQHFDRFDGRSSVKTWLFRIAHNLCVDRARKAARSIEEQPLPVGLESEDRMDLSDPRWEPERLAMEGELAEAVEQAIAGMSEKLRSVLLLHDKEDASYDEIAQALGLPVGTVKSRLFLARVHLQKCLTPYLKGGQVS
ncbi:MAG: sigma-70 family RNA polymerase sigma factor, partial [Fimbriimonas ginsengisoli]|nr:sigma-70 family RNA polymerase sigma factor [Fimbriimonas ginsengisoli]